MGCKVNGVNYEQMEEQLVVKRAQHGDGAAQNYLIKRYKNIVRYKAKSYFLIGADKDDVIQEGMIGLFKAIRDYRADKNTAFKSFAEICVTKQMLTAVRMATRLKHVPLNSYVSLSESQGERAEDCQRYIATELAADPETIVISGEQVALIESKIEQVLSEFELKVLRQHLAGKGYREIAKDLDHNAKSVDNALQRIKKKLAVLRSRRR
ncbi:MAG: RNA polymerase factor sigma-70 [Clostridiales bacterium]|nr:MAG: RNA polymerase factor sigma-70 [Clostridiales bacterium]